jgi:hypothetical protein
MSDTYADIDVVAKQLVITMAALSDNERLKLFREISEHYCFECGSKIDDYCCCQYDD